MKPLSLSAFFFGAALLSAADVIPAESPVNYMQRLIIEGEKDYLYDLYGANDPELGLEYLRTCEPETYKKMQQYPHADVSAALAACQQWYEATQRFTDAWWQLELSKQKNLFDFRWRVSNTVKGIIYADARALAGTACWYRAETQSRHGVEPQHGYSCFQAPAGAPEQLQHMLAPLNSLLLGKHESIQLVAAALTEFQRLHQQDVADFSQEYLRHPELIRLFNEAESARQAYFRHMQTAISCHCLCTDGTEFRIMHLHMLAHHSRWLKALRTLATPQHYPRDGK